MQSEKGLNTHTARKQLHIAKVKCPYICELCEKDFGNEEFKRHFLTHSYKEV